MRVIQSLRTEAAWRSRYDRIVISHLASMLTIINCKSDCIVWKSTISRIF